LTAVHADFIPAAANSLNGGVVLQPGCKVPATPFFLQRRRNRNNRGSGREAAPTFPFSEMIELTFDTTRKKVANLRYGISHAFF
jgi:hypothetical protein